MGRRLRLEGKPGSEKRKKETWKKKQRERKRESFGWAACRRGDFWWLRRIRGSVEEGEGWMLCLVTDLRCDPEGRTSPPSVWPTASEAAGWKTTCKRLALTGWQARNGRSQRSQPGWGVEGCGRKPVLPITPPHLGQWTKGPPARPEEEAGEGGGRGESGDKQLPKDHEWSFDRCGLTLIEEVNEGIARQQNKKKKVFLLHVPWNSCSHRSVLLN